MDLWVISVVKKLFRRVVVYIFAFIVVWLLLNRWFLMIFWTAIWKYNWPWGTGIEILRSWWIIFLLLVGFPLVYFLLFKWWYFETIVGLVRHEYREDLINWMVKYSSHMVIIHYKEVKWNVQILHTKMDNWFDDTPFWSKLLVNYLQRKLPLIDKIVDIIWTLDEEAFANEWTLQLAIHKKLKPYLLRTSVETEWWLYWIIKIIMVNLAVLFVLYLILFYV